MMEIERKFLVKGDFRKEAYAFSEIGQGYLNSSPDRTVRVRLRDGKGYLTVKGAGSASGMSRFEWEKEIEVEEARALLSLAEPGVIEKTRYLIAAADGIHTWEVDVFHGANEGLIMAEIELNSEDETFSRPDWLGDEVTGDQRYYNSCLSRRPYREW